MPEVKKKTKEHESVLVLLQEAQEKFGYIPEDFMANVARSLDISLSEVFGVATFYSFLTCKPLGRNVIRVCKSLPCCLKDAQMIIESVESELRIKPGETTADGKFSLTLTNCVGACDKAPAMMINDDTYTDLTPGKISQILKKCK
ncbi:MAG: NADH-quinone oxidoreductase subunit NuoE [Chloroflexi bacterium]|nr:NADH-quinone oxidoreductase subunit NuoE [Chloroflexota bacterium]